MEESSLSEAEYFKYLVGQLDLLDEEQLQEHNLESSVDLVDNGNWIDLDEIDCVPAAEPNGNGIDLNTINSARSTETNGKDKLLSFANANQDSDNGEWDELAPADCDSPTRDIKPEFTPPPFSPVYDSASVVLQPGSTHINEEINDWIHDFTQFGVPEDTVTAPTDSAGTNCETLTLTHSTAEAEPTSGQGNNPNLLLPEPRYNENNGNGRISLDQEASQIASTQEDANETAHIPASPADCAGASQIKILKRKASQGLRQVKKQPGSIRKRLRKSKLEPRVVAEEILPIANDFTQQSFPNVIAEGNDNSVGSICSSLGPTTSVQRRKSDEERKARDREASKKSRMKKNKQRCLEDMYLEDLQNEVEEIIEDGKTVMAKIQRHRMAKDNIKCQFGAYTIGAYVSDQFPLFPLLRPETFACNTANEQEDNLLSFSNYNLDKELAAIEVSLPDAPPCNGPPLTPQQRSKLARDRQAANDKNRKMKIELLGELKDKFQKQNKYVHKLLSKVNSEIALIKTFTSGECRRFCAELIAGFKGDKSTLCLQIAEWFFDVYISVEDFMEACQIERRIKNGEQSFVPSDGKFLTFWSQTPQQTTILGIDFIPQCPPLRTDIPYYMDSP